MFKFIKFDGIIKEIDYNSLVDYEKIFNKLSTDIIEDLIIVTEYYYSLLKKDIENDSINNIIYNISSVKEINGIPIKINLYILTNYKRYIDDKESVKIGINVCLPIDEYINSEMYELLQHIYFLNCDITNDNNLKNYLYNILFYAHIIIKNFKYHPLLFHLHHEDDIKNIVNIKSSFIKLFGEFNKCCVCYENTITYTICKHYLCQLCYSKLTEKKCPICRNYLSNENSDYTYEINMDM